MTSVPTIGAATARAALVGLALALSSACGGSSDSTTTAPAQDVIPATATAVSTDTIRAIAGSTAPGAIGVTVKNKEGSPIDSAVVTFAVVSGGGSLAATSVRTNAAGLASTTWTLGNSASTQIVTATAGTLAPVTFVAIATAGAASAVAKLAGDAQTALVGANLPILPSVKITDSFGNPVSNVLVTFTTGSSGGFVNGGAVNTGADGVATVAGWRLGGIAGTYTLIATAGNNLSATFTATAVAGAPATVVLTPLGPFALNAGQTQSITAKVADSSGNALATAPVVFTSSNSAIASVSSAGLITANAAGVATITATSGAATASVTVSVTGHPSGAAISATYTFNSTLGGVAFTANSTLLSLNSMEQIITFDALATLQTTTPLQLTTPLPLLIAGYKTSGPALAVNQGTTSRVWYVDPTANAVIDSVDITEAVVSAAIKSDGSRAFFLLSDGEVAVLDVASRTQLARIPLGGGVTRMKLDRGDTLAYAFTNVGIVFEIDTRTNTVKRQIIIPNVPVTDFEISRDGNFVLLLDGTPGIVRIYDVATFTLQRTVGVTGSATSITLSPDDRQIWTTNNTSTPQVNWVTGSITTGYISGGSIPLATSPMRIYFSPTGSFAAITESGGSLDIVR